VKKDAPVSIDTHIIFLYCLFLSNKVTYVIVGGIYQLALSIVEKLKILQTHARVGLKPAKAPRYL